MIVLASDHAGVALKTELIQFLESRGDAFRDLGPLDERSVEFLTHAKHER